jgi:hypothetical protein
VDLPVPEDDSAEVVGAILVETGGGLDTGVGLETGVGVETGVGDDVAAELDAGADVAVDAAVDVAVDVDDVDVCSGDATGARGVVVLRTGGCRICGRSCGRS